MILVKGHIYNTIPKEDKLFVSPELLDDLKDKRYDFCRDDEDFEKLTEELHKIATESGVYERGRNGTTG